MTTASVGAEAHEECRGEPGQVAHGNRQAFAERPGDCHAFKPCVDACPENAIELARYRSPGRAG